MTLCFASGMALAQDAPDKAGPGNPVLQKTAALTAQFNLTEEQQAKVQEIVANQIGQVKALKADSTLTDEQRKEKAQALSKAAMEQILALLTPEQKEAWRQKRREKNTPVGNVNAPDADKEKTP